MSKPPAAVRGRRAFEELRRGRRAGDSIVRVQFAPSSGDQLDVRVAYAVNRKVGGAVVRNRWRRRLRSIAAEASGDLAPGTYLIGLSPDVWNLSYQELRERVITTMRRATRERR